MWISRVKKRNGSKKARNVNLKHSPAFFFIHTDHHHTFVAPDPDEFVDGSDSSSGELTEQDHPLDVVVLQQTHIGAHLCYRSDIDHHHIFHLWKPVLVESTAECWHLDPGRRKQSNVSV